MATQTTRVAGTFSGTGSSDDIRVTKRGLVKLSFAGTATVALQAYSEQVGDFIDTGDSWTATTVEAIDGHGQRMRLNCSAHTDNVVYELLP